MTRTPPAALLITFGAASLAAVALGAWVCAASGVPAALWIRNLAAWLVGALAAVAIIAAYRPVFLKVALAAAPLALAAGFASPGMQGVHRWADLGPLHVNLAMLTLPAAAVALAALAPGRRWPWIAAFTALGLLVVQPDASQATSFAVVAALVAASTVPRPILRIALIAVAALLAALAWTMADPLAPVPEVEEIIGLAATVSPLAAVLAWILLLAAASAPALASLSAPPAVRLAGAALSACLLLWALTTLLGAFPVPFVGIGLSPILGAWLGAGLLAGLARRERAT